MRRLPKVDADFAEGGSARLCGSSDLLCDVLHGVLLVHVALRKRQRILRAGSESSVSHLDGKARLQVEDAALAGRGSRRGCLRRNFTSSRLDCYPQTSDSASQVAATRTWQTFFAKATSRQMTVFLYLQRRKANVNI